MGRYMYVHVHVYNYRLLVHIIYWSVLTNCLIFSTVIIIISKKCFEALDSLHELLYSTLRLELKLGFSNMYMYMYTVCNACIITLFCKSNNNGSHHVIHFKACAQTLGYILLIMYMYM